MREAGPEVDVEIESLAPGGDAAGRQRARRDEGRGIADPDGAHEGRVVFVPLAAPGERVRVRLVREKERVAWGELVAIERPGPDRAHPSCPLFGSCGGCQWQHVTLAAQRAAKRAIVERALGVSVGPVLAAGPAFGYRDRAQLAVGSDPAPPSPAARAVGFRARRSNQIVDVAGCPLFSARLAAALPAARALGAGLAAGAELDLQAGAEGVHLNVASVDAAGAAHARREFERLAASGIVGLALAGRPALGLPEVNVSESGGSPLPVPAGGFAQVGATGNAVLVAAVLEAIGGAPGVVLELYAGSGNFTRHLAARATRVLACDADQAAVERGRRAAPAAGWSRRIPDVVADVVVMDPPREGADASHLAAALRARRRIVYVSCDPQTLARDGRRIAAAGFRLTGAVALDLMPQTFHVEVVATFEPVSARGPIGGSACHR